MTSADAGPADSSVTELSERAVRTIATGDPCLAVILGLPEATEALTDYSPAGYSARHAEAAELLRTAEALPAATSADRVARDVMVHQLRHTVAAAEAGDHLRDVNILSSPPQHIRMALEFAAPDQRAALVAAVPAAMAGWRETLTEGIASGSPAARRQAITVAEQLATYGNDWLTGFRDRSGMDDDVVRGARRAFLDTSVWLSDVYAPQAESADAVGEERYLRAAAAFNGLDLDLDDTYDWGWVEVERLSRELRAEVDRLEPGLPLGDVRARLDADPQYQIHGTTALLHHLRELTDTATARVDGELFDLDPRVRECGVQLAAEGSAAAPYYVPPSEDLSRPGSTWYPTRGADVFPRWWLETVWFHEGVPGHHLQVGATATMADMSRFQRVLGMTSGQAEGWALYAERLCDELGWFDEPGTRIGFLSAQLMRAVRVVVDIGLHTHRSVPRGVRSERGPITPRLAEQLLVNTALVEPGFAASEVDRYLGMPGQAISYKVGERVWLDLRDEARIADPEFDLKSWHMTALQLGPMGLAQFRAEMSALAR